MLNRILLVLKTQNLSSSQFADEIGVQRSSISHILSGRNNPSLEFVTKILKRFPDINSEWILFGKGSMYRESGNQILTKQELKSTSAQADLFTFEETPQVEMSSINEDLIKDDVVNQNLKEERVAEGITFPIDNVDVISEKTIEKTVDKNVEIEKNEENETFINKKKKEIEKIVIFYSDKTFREYFPE